MIKKHDDIFLDSFIVAPSATKKYFLNLKNKNSEYNFKFLTKEELQEHTFGKIKKDEAILLLMQKENINFSIAKKYVNFLGRGATGKVNDLDFDELRSLLESKKLITLFDTFHDLIKNKKVVFVSYSKKNLEIRNLINTLKLKDIKYIQFAEFFDKNPAKTLYKFENLEEEVKYTLNLLADELDRKNKVKLICNKNKYSYYLDIFGNSMNLKFNYLDKDSLFNTEFGKSLFNIVKDDPKVSLIKYMEKNGKDLKNKYKEQYELIKDVLDKYQIDSLTGDRKIINLKEILKGFSKPNVRYENAPVVSSSFDFDETYEYYFLDMCEGNFPHLATNNDFLDDEDKKKINIETSDQYNETVIDLSTAILSFKTTKFMSFYLVDNNKINEGSFFVLNGKDPIDVEYLGYEYSKTIASNFYKTYQYKYDKYGDIKEDFRYFKSTTDLSYSNDFDPKFKNFNFTTDPNLKYSYSTISLYFECPFKFYCQKVLSLYLQEDESFFSKYGTFAHSVLEHVFEKSPNYDSLYDKEKGIGKFTTKKEIFFLEALRPRLKRAFDLLRDRKEKQTFDKEPSKEVELTYPFKPNRELEGILDSVVFLKSKSKKYLYVVDYKTGKPPTFDTKKLSEGHKGTLQLSTYLYLLKKTNEYKGYEPIGFYIQPINMTFKDIIKENIKPQLSGITLDDQDVFLALDKTISSGISNILQLDKLKNVKGRQSSTTFEEIINSYEDLLNDFDKKYNEGEFKIEANNKTTCKYCEFESICYLKNRSIKNK